MKALVRSVTVMTPFDGEKSCEIMKVNEFELVSPCASDELIRTVDYN